MQQFTIPTESLTNISTNIENSTHTPEYQCSKPKLDEEKNEIMQINHRGILQMQKESTNDFYSFQIQDEIENGQITNLIKQCSFRQQAPKNKLFSIPQIESIFPQIDESKEEITNLSKFLHDKLTLDESQKLLNQDLFNSIKHMNLVLLDLQPNIEPKKKSSPPPGFEQQFNQPQILQQNQYYSQQQFTSLQIPCFNSMPTIYMSEDCNKQQASIPGKVLYIRGLDNPSLNLSSLYSIFSNFGLVIRMLYFRQKGALLIQYSTIQQAMQCKEWMNRIQLCGNIIKIFDSNHKEIKFKQQGQNIGDYWERDLLSQDNRGKQVNPPSDVVHIANLRPEACSQNIIIQVFGMVGYVQNIKLISTKMFIFIRFLLDDPQKKMCLVKYLTVEESINAVAFLHGYWLYGRLKFQLFKPFRQIQVSFTRSKI